ncbi:hypothetical protein MRB53_032861 [Persea americana]|uniref:Uncharacterized protein n=1 Tax=Persea americana TaxID=3435 RepID=A0ACC2KT60_PERAE|nr:hypothetical protein MRB53_032861 [Persea americana]
MGGGPMEAWFGGMFGDDVFGSSLILLYKITQIQSHVFEAYPHKILTGRRSRMHTIRQTSGLAGFPKRDESVHDAFGAGHSSTSISTALGMYGFSIFLRVDLFINF